MVMIRHTTPAHCCGVQLARFTSPAKTREACQEGPSDEGVLPEPPVVPPAGKNLTDHSPSTVMILVAAGDYSQAGP